MKKTRLDQRIDSRQAKLPTLRAILAKGHFRLVMLAVLLATASLTVTGAFLLRDYAHLNLQLAAKTLSYVVEPAVYFGDIPAVEQATRSVGASETIRQVEVLDLAGSPLSSWSPSSGNDDMFTSWLDGIIWPNPIDVSIISQSGDALGSVRVFGSARGLAIYLLAGVLVSMGCLGLTILATRMLARKLENGVLHPLSHVADVAAAVRNNREFSRRVAASNIAEIDRFTNDFNGLLAELEGWHDGFVSENEALAHKASHDSLTGLGNRDLFESELGRAIERADAAGQQFALLYVDIDNFKLINDTAGHADGDRVLKAVSSRLQLDLRARDQAFRLGGDEFAVLVDLWGSDRGVERVTERVLEATDEPVVLGDGEPIRVTLSVGAAVYPRDGRTAEDLLRRADHRMYISKKGRNLRVI